MDVGESTTRGAAPVVAIVIGSVPGVEVIGEGLTGAVLAVGVGALGCYERRLLLLIQESESQASELGLSWT